MKIDIEVSKKDAARLKQKFNHLQSFIRGDIVRIIQKNADMAVEEMQSEVPVDTGRLQRGIEVVDGTNSTVVRSIAESDAGYDYAPKINEYGGRFQRGVFFFTNAIQRMKDKLRVDLKRNIQRILKRR